MAEFTVPVVRIEAIEPIEGADAIELAVVGGYRSVVGKGSFKGGDLAVYLPEQAILPDWLINKLGLDGKLSGSAKNRVKAVKLRGQLSQGILYPTRTVYEYEAVGSNIPIMDTLLVSSYETVISFGDAGPEERTVQEGDDVAEFLGVKKWEPEMSGEMRKRLHGECVYIPGKTVKFDIENWKKHNRAFAEGDEVVITEKLHGTMCCFAVYPGLNHPELPDDVFVYSKGLGGSGQVFKWNDANVGNFYIQAYHAQTANARTIAERIKEHFPNQPVFLFGEVFGKGVQDLGYGQDKPTFQAFDIWIGTPQEGHFVDADEKFELFERYGIPHVPVLYKGPFDLAKMLELTDGKTAVGGDHIREGVVITSATERYEHRIGRLSLKNVSGDYLTRKGKTTEFN